MSLNDFRLLRDAYQRERRESVYSLLCKQQSKLQKDMKTLKSQRGERVNVALEEDVKALGFKLQDVGYQVSAIEREMFIPYALGFVVRQ